MPGEDSPVSCEEVAGNAPETIWTLSRRDLMPPSEIETRFHGRVARSPITMQKKPFGPVKNNSHVKNKHAPTNSLKRRVSYFRGFRKTVKSGH